MPAPPDDISDIAWVPQAQILDLGEVSRATLNSWIKAGLDIPKGAAAYKVDDLIKIIIFASARKHLTPQRLVRAWGELAKTGEAAAIKNAARQLKADEPFDLVIDVKYFALAVVQSDEELISAVRHPTAPRPVVVIDLAEKMRSAIGGFFRSSNEGSPPAQRKRGRPKRAKGPLHLVSEESGG